MRETLPILGPSSGNSLVQVNPQKTVNMYVKIEQPGALSPISLRRTPGLTLIDNTDTGGVGRSNGVRWRNKEYFIIGSRLISVTDNNVITAEGVLLTNSGRCVIARGRDYLLIVDGTYGYAWDGATFTSNIQSSDADFPSNPTHAVYVDGYFLVNESGTDNLYRSASEDPTDWDALLFGVASASPDNIIGLEVFGRDIIVAGEDSIQRYFNNSGTGFNFQSYPSNFELGLIAPYSLAHSAFGGTGLMHSDEGGIGVYTIAGGSMTLESTDDDAEEIASFSTVSDAFGMAFMMNNIAFYVITFPAAAVTKVFQIGRNLSHHLESRDSDSASIGRWRVSGLGYTGKRILAVDYNSDNIYLLDKDAYTENGNNLICDRYTQIVHSQGMTFSCSRYEINAKRGVGLISGSGSDPKIQLRISRDGGETYSEFRNKPIGKIGQYEKRSVYRQLGGDFVQFNTHMRYSEPTDFAIFGGNMDITF